MHEFSELDHIWAMTHYHCLAQILLRFGPVRTGNIPVCPDDSWPWIEWWKNAQRVTKNSNRSSVYVFIVVYTNTNIENIDLYRVHFTYTENMRIFILSMFAYKCSTVRCCNSLLYSTILIIHIKFYRFLLFI